MINMTKKYTTRDGRAVRVLAVDAKSQTYPVVALVAHPGGEESTEVFTATGGYHADPGETSLDLIEEAPKLVRFFPLTKAGGGNPRIGQEAGYGTLKECMQYHSDFPRVGVLEVTYQEGNVPVVRVITVDEALGVSRGARRSEF